MSDFTAKRPVVLVVEDDFLIRMNAAEMIADAGFDVIEAASADEAILILEDRLDITVVFTDIQMPGSMDGLKLAAAMRRRRFGLCLIALAGLRRRRIRRLETWCCRRGRRRLLLRLRWLPILWLDCG